MLLASRAAARPIRLLLALLALLAGALATPTAAYAKGDLLGGLWQTEHGSVIKFSPTAGGRYAGDLARPGSGPCWSWNILVNGDDNRHFTGSMNLYDYDAAGNCTGNPQAAAITIDVARDGKKLTLRYTDPASLGCCEEPFTFTRIGPPGPGAESGPAWWQIGLIAAGVLVVAAVVVVGVIYLWPLIAGGGAVAGGGTAVGVGTAATAGAEVGAGTVVVETVTGTVATGAVETGAAEGAAAAANPFAGAAEGLPIPEAPAPNPFAGAGEPPANPFAGAGEPVAPPQATPVEPPPGTRISPEDLLKIQEGHPPLDGPTLDTGPTR
ncbi:hypothetical protein [Hamadaea tsunoensis]|uniref:hypothetical protein n=1 Tax=Hamadaea tsunoensis TaxID=53368 RepID=UPI0012F8662C|nr:hypothetical protein [Hamadaea tsunoensis]